MAALALMVEKVMIWATRSSPYFCETYLMTSPRRRSSRSMSISGMDLRPGFKNRSKPSFQRMGSSSVMARQ
jgi:hypothetical protein